ncbi:MAG: hypothetical protein HYS20_09090 [Rhodocyclales bacterium]|nr:hypothetical protein [Rhodocyclales bacterium]
MRRFGFGLLFAVIGFIMAALVGYFLIGQFSPNQHDREIEAAMTSIFVLGPLGAVAGFIAGVIRGGRKPAESDADRDGRV